MRWVGLELRLVSARRFLRCLGSVVRRRCKVKADKKTVSEPSYHQTQADYLAGPLAKTLRDMTYSLTSLARVLHRRHFPMKRSISLGKRVEVWKST
jgi:hypothetical protein